MSELCGLDRGTWIPSVRDGVWVGWSGYGWTVDPDQVTDFGTVEALRDYLKVWPDVFRRSRDGYFDWFEDEYERLALGGNSPTPFTNQFDSAQLNSLRYNTSQYGSPIPMVFGQQRVGVNLLEYFGFKGSGAGGKGGKGGGASAGKKGSGTQNYTVNVAFGLCEGPVAFGDKVWANGNFKTGGPTGVHLNGYVGNDGQDPDPVFESSDTNTPVLGYSGLCYVTGTPMQLGSTPALPQVSFQIRGFNVGTAGPWYPDDARPDMIATTMLTDDRVGAGFPTANIDLSDWGNYCQAAQLAMSLVVDRSQPCARWLEELAQLTVSAVVWSGSLLRVVPYGDLTLVNNDATWTPNLTWQYSFTDADYLVSAGTHENESDPVLVSLADLSQRANWMSIEFMDSTNNYNQALLPGFDQGQIDNYGLRTKPSIPGHEFTNRSSATVSLYLQLQREQYIRKTFKFKVGFKHARLEPMDIVLLTDSVSGLGGAAARILSIDEDENGELSITAEEIPGLTP